MSGKVPEGWKIIKVKDIAEIIRGVSFGKDDASVVKGDNSIAILRGGNIQDGKIIDNEDLVYVDAKFVSAKQIIRNGDVIIVGSTGSKKLIGKAAHALFDYSDVSFGAFLTMLRPIGVVNPRFFNYYFQTEYYREEIRKLAGGININNIKNQHLEGLVFPLPPLAEQHRLVTKLDALFGSLEQLKSRLNTIPQLLKTFRQAVLTQAVTGKLTREWRGYESNSLPYSITIGNEFKEAPKGWEWRKLVNISQLESGHTPRKSVAEYWDNGDVKWICLQDIRALDGKVAFDTKYKTTQLGIKNSSARVLPKGTVCFSRDISVGFVTIMGCEMATTQHFANFICHGCLNNYFLMYAFMASRDYLINSGVGTTVKTLYMPTINDFYILLPPLPEQQEIVRRVEGLLSKADAIEARYRALKGQVDALPQAVLGKAFRGELR
ncbi:type I restriction enzyme S subunit [Breznakibacter xylanolyticus]|uniref:Type I restriction enzyme S subunit n=1 Tax=Breznakibacter xylanolyticus TaxID=990 RepID=A0A2W7PKX0_9BACT|nr:restriction endonuclease subunit S [Breznakibacter xylanolyticus]PZX09939.1 type I restriction enzyme S subunit [Breznakibacter xylanolyticus]